jgi:hypothetical protein
MATVNKRVLGNVRGRIGDIVFSRWKGLYVAKGRPGRRVKENLEAPLPEQKLRVRLISTNLNKFSNYVKIGFSSKYTKATPYSRAYKYNLNNAIKGSYPNLEIDYSKFTVSQGSREIAWGAKVYFEPDRFLRVTWQIPEVCDINEIGDDIAYIVVYQPGDALVYAIELGRFTALRSDLSLRARISYHHDLPRGGISHVWIFFASPDGKQTSNSIYVGSGYPNRAKK